MTFSWLRWPRFGESIRVTLIYLWTLILTLCLKQSKVPAGKTKKTAAKMIRPFPAFWPNESTRVLETNRPASRVDRPHGTGKESMHHPLGGELGRARFVTNNQPTQHLQEDLPVTWEPLRSCLTLVIHAWLKRPSLRCSQDQGESLKETESLRVVGCCLHVFLYYGHWEIDTSPTFF